METTSRRPTSLDRPIEELGLSAWPLNRLRGAQISTIRKLVQHTPGDLLSIVGFGRTCLSEVIERLQEAGVSLRTEELLARSSSRTRILRATTIDEPLLDRALDELLRMFTVKATHRSALKARLGWGGNSPCTLEEAAQMAGLTRERIRQIQNRFEERIRGRVRLPSLERALEALHPAIPTTVASAAEILIDKGIAGRPLHPAGLVRLASILGVRPKFEVVRLEPLGEVVVALGSAREVQVLRNLRRELRRRTRPFGFIHVELAREVIAQIVGKTGGGLERLALNAVEGVPLGGGWFYVSADTREPAIRLLEDMLAVAGGTLSVLDIQEGFARRLRWRGSGGHHDQDGWYPTTEAIQALCRLRPDLFRVEGDRIATVRSLDWRKRLSGTERVLVETLLDAPGHVLHRDDFARDALARGVNVNTFSIHTTYSPFLRDLGGGLWGVRGIGSDPLEVERLRRRARPRQRQIEDWQWLPDGALRLVVRLHRVDSLVVGLPVAVRPYLAGRTFVMTLADGTRVGQVRIDEGGTSWGYGPALRQLRAARGSLMRADFDLASSAVRIHIEAPPAHGGGVWDA